jgi:hypothetical protein
MFGRVPGISLILFFRVEVVEVADVIAPDDQDVGRALRHIGSSSIDVVVEA